MAMAGLRWGRAELEPVVAGWGGDRPDDAAVHGVMGRRIADATVKTKMRGNGAVRSTKAALRSITQPSRTNRRFSAVRGQG